MNYKLIIFAAVITITAFLGCERTEIKRAEDRFFYPRALKVETLFGYHDADVSLSFNRNVYYSAESGGEDNTRFKQYVYYFNDFGYRYDRLVGCYDGEDDLGPEHPYTVSVCAIKEIHIVCNDDYDESHPKGSNADDLFSIRLQTSYPYIKNGYEGGNYDGKIFSLDNINPDYLKLTGECFAYLVINDKPEESGIYSFTVSVIMEPDPVSGDTPNFKPQTFKLNF